MRFLVLLLVAACAPDPTVGDAVDRFAESTCERYRRCGWTADTQDVCEAKAREYVCSRWACEAPISNRKYDDLLACTGAYEVAACEDPVPYCLVDW